jgi:hypothetical protein
MSYPYNALVGFQRDRPPGGSLFLADLHRKRVLKSPFVGFGTDDQDESGPSADPAVTLARPGETASMVMIATLLRVHLS